jgi:prevent-host-death family protein
MPLRNGHNNLVMAKKRTNPPAPPGKPPSDQVGAADFKARCLELMDRVRETRVEYVVTKHGKPVAKLVPITESATPRSFFGALKGSVLKYDRPFDPIDGSYDIDQ